MEQTEFGTLLLESGYFLKHEEIPCQMKTNIDISLYKLLSSSSTESKTRSYINDKNKFLYLY